MDITKIVLMINRDYYKPGVIDGYSLSKRLRFEFGIQSEYDSKTMVLLMTSIGNEACDFEALKGALIQIDRDIIEETAGISLHPIGEELIKYEATYRAIASEGTYRMRAYDAVHLPNTLKPIVASIGEISAEYIIPYPPGIPILVPGERIHKETLKLFPVEKTHIKVLK